MTTTDNMTTLVDNSTNNRGSSKGNYEYWLCMSYSIFSNISVISFRSCLLLEKTRVLWEINYLYLICHTHTGYLLPHNRETRSVLLSLRLPRFQSVFTSYIFFSIPRQFCCKNMNYNNLSETYVCIHIKIMNYRGKLKTLITEKR
jgi:hypothetical protein